MVNEASSNVWEIHYKPLIRKASSSMSSLWRGFLHFSTTCFLTRGCRHLGQSLLIKDILTFTAADLKDCCSKPLLMINVYCRWLTFCWWLVRKWKHFWPFFLYNLSNIYNPKGALAPNCWWNSVDSRSTYLLVQEILIVNVQSHTSMTTEQTSSANKDRVIQSKVQEWAT